MPPNGSDERDDLGDDDPQLKSLRAVWVSMRDEEPPARGLDALLAAAREQADNMKPREPWWQRVLVTLRKPPVLALATITVLLGGAVLITQRKDEMTAAPQRAAEVSVSEKGAGGGEHLPLASKDSPSSGAVATPEVTADRANELSAGEATGSPAAAAGSAAPIEEQPPARTAPAKPDPTSVRHTKPAAVATGSKQKKPAGTPKADAIATDRDDDLRFAEPPPAKNEAYGGPAGGDVDKPADPAALDQGLVSDAKITEAPKPNRPAKAPLGRKPAPAIEGEDRSGGAGASPGAGTPSSIDALVKQIEAAAARGDCTAVKSLAKKLQTLSPTAYRQRVASRVEITRCLQP